MRARGYRRSGSPLGAHLRDDSRRHQARSVTIHNNINQRPGGPSSSHRAGPERSHRSQQARIELSPLVGPSRIGRPQLNIARGERLWVLLRLADVRAAHRRRPCPGARVSVRWTVGFAVRRDAAHARVGETRLPRGLAQCLTCGVTEGRDRIGEPCPEIRDEQGWRGPTIGPRVCRRGRLPARCRPRTSGGACARRAARLW